MADVVAEDQTQEAPRGAVTGVPPSGTVHGGDEVSPYIGGPPRFPRRYVYLAAYAVLGLLFVLAIGIFLANRLGSTTGSSTASGTVRSPTSGVPSGVAPPASARGLHAPLSKFLGINPLKGRAATGFSLRDAKTGAPVSLASLSGHVVVLSFANAPCNDICPVLATEVHQAASLLTVTKVPVTFVTINTDPLDTNVTDAPIVRQPLLSSVPNWRFLTGSVDRLNPIWKAYGVAIAVDETTHRVSHNDPLYFISPQGKLAWSATVFGDEAAHGHYTLPKDQISRYATGIAHYARKLATQG